MARQSGNSLFGSLRGKIWISTSVLAFFICTFGLISYLVVSLLVNDPFFGVFIPFLILAFMVMLFGWWLSNEVVNPVEKVILLAKSLERSSSTTVPRTSGSTETDQLLETIQKNNQQVQKIVTLMDKVANGNLDVAPMQGSDRLSTSFQKLLSKVSESIHAKEELDELNKAVDDLTLDVSTVRSGNLDASIRNEYPQTREISETVKYLIDNMSRLITNIRDGAEGAEGAVKRVEEELQTLIVRDEGRVQDMSQASIALKQVPNLISKITEDLMGSAKSARQSIEKARHGTKIANQNSNSVSNLRKQVREDVKRIQSLNERSHDIEKVAKTVEDLANRTNMIALNASIQATEMGEEGHGFVLVAEEVERLAARANGTNKQISTLNKSILAEIGKVENSVETTMAEVASLSKFAIESGNVLGEMERYVAHFLNLQENLIAYSKDQSEETDNAFKIFAEAISETESTIAKLKDSSSELSSVAGLARELNLSVGEFKLAEKMPFFESQNSDDISHEAFSEETEENDSFDELQNPEFKNVAHGASGPETSESDDSNIENPEFEQKSTAAENPHQPDEAEEFDPAEFSLEISGEQNEDSVKPNDHIDAETSDEQATALQSVESVENADKEEEYSMHYSPEGKERSDDPEDSNENGVLDLYNLSYNTGSETSGFDSDDFSSDELIEASGGEDQKPLQEIDAAEVSLVESDKHASNQPIEAPGGKDQDLLDEFDTSEVSLVESDEHVSNEPIEESSKEDRNPLHGFDAEEFTLTGADGFASDELIEAPRGKDKDLLDEFDTSEVSLIDAVEKASNEPIEAPRGKDQDLLDEFDTSEVSLVESDEHVSSEPIEESSKEDRNPLHGFEAEEFTLTGAGGFASDELIEELGLKRKDETEGLDAVETTFDDSDDFATDELIEESGPKDHTPVQKFNAPQATVIDSDDLDNLLESIVFENPSADNDLTV